MSRGTLEEIASLIDAGYSVEDALRKVNGHFEVGSPGTELRTTRVNGVEYAAEFRINDFSNQPAQFVLHRHSTTLPAVILGARAKSDNTAHANMASGDTLMSLIAAGWGGSSYYLSSVIDMKVGTGTVSNTSMPGEIIFSLSADGSTSPSEVLKLESNKNATFGGNVGIGDNKRYYAGADNDADFYHSGSNTFITNRLGSLYLSEAVNSGLLIVDAYNSAGTNKICAVFGGATPKCQFYYDGGLVAETAAAGLSLSAGQELIMNRTTDDDGFINFQATINADATSAISSFTTSAATTHHIQILINGTPAWIAVSTTDPTA